jgi:lysine 2,3-aminomutase
MVQGIEDLRTPLSQIIKLDKELRGTLSGFMMPSFVIDLPGGGGKRLVSTYESYDPTTGVAKYKAPGLPGAKGEIVYTYHDPKPVQAAVLEAFREHQHQALQNGKTLEQFVFKPTRAPTRAPTPAPPVVPKAPSSIPLSGIIRGGFPCFEPQPQLARARAYSTQSTSNNPANTD